MMEHVDTRVGGNLLQTRKWHFAYQITGAFFAFIKIPVWFLLVTALFA